jgi:predicted nucleic acid-binding protein
MVMDASAVVELLLQTPVAASMAEEILLSPSDLHAPHLVDAEVAQVLRRLCSWEEVPESRALEALQDLRDLPLVRHSHELLLDRAWELRDNLTIYDGVYVALAELLDMPLLTRDRRIAAAPGHGATVRVIS